MKTLRQLKDQLIESIIEYPFLYSADRWVWDILTIDEKFNDTEVLDEWWPEGMKNDGTTIFRLVSCYYIPKEQGYVVLDYEKGRQVKNSKV